MLLSLVNLQYATLEMFKGALNNYLMLKLHFLNQSLPLVLCK